MGLDRGVPERGKDVVLKLGKIASAGANTGTTKKSCVKRVQIYLHTFMKMMYIVSTNGKGGAYGNCFF